MNFVVTKLASNHDDPPEGISQPLHPDVPPGPRIPPDGGFGRSGNFASSSFCKASAAAESQLRFAAISFSMMGFASSGSIPGAAMAPEEVLATAAGVPELPLPAAVPAFVGVLLDGGVRGRTGSQEHGRNGARGG